MIAFTVSQPKTPKNAFAELLKTAGYIATIGRNAGSWVAAFFMDSPPVERRDFALSANYDCAPLEGYFRQ